MVAAPNSGHCNTLPTKVDHVGSKVQRSKTSKGRAKSAHGGGQKRKSDATTKEAPPCIHWFYEEINSNLIIKRNFVHHTPSTRCSPSSVRCSEMNNLCNAWYVCSGACGIESALGKKLIN